MNEYIFTQHATFKMKYYGLSKQKINNVVRRPDRMEGGIAGHGTVAVMQAVSPKVHDGKKLWKQEIWVLYQKKSAVKPSENIQKSSNEAIARLQQLLQKNESLNIISAWRYPGMSPKNNPIPDDILQEIDFEACISENNEV